VSRGPATVARAALLALLALAGCRFERGGVNSDAEAGACPGVHCGCADAEACAPSCPLDGCQLTCERLDTCLAACGDDCDTSATSARRLELTCGDGCRARCEAVGACDVSCGRDCRVDCTDVDRCRVIMHSGAARCRRAGACEVACARVDGVPAAATAGPDGLYTCDDRLAPR
jgi:hypothetical protein